MVEHSFIFFYVVERYTVSTYLTFEKFVLLCNKMDSWTLIFV